MSGQAPQPIMVLGAAGGFGSRLCRLLLEGGAHVVGVGRRTAPLDALVHDLSDLGSLEGASGAVPDDLDVLLRRHRPEIVIDTTGPFQGRALDAPTQFIAHVVHYIDLSDGRAGAAAITALDDTARQAGIVAISGASTVSEISDIAYSDTPDAHPILARDQALSHLKMLVHSGRLSFSEDRYVVD